MKNRTCQSIALLTIIILCGGMSLAPFAQNYAAWKALSHQQKLGFVMGVFDKEMEFNPMGNGADQVYAMSLLKCTTKMGLSNELLVELLDDHYKNNRNSQKDAASEVLGIALFKICKSTINLDLKASGMTPLP